MHAIPAGLANKIGSERHAQANNKLLAMHLYGDIGARRRGQTGAETLDAARPSLSTRRAACRVSCSLHGHRARRRGRRRRVGRGRGRGPEAEGVLPALLREGAPHPADRPGVPHGRGAPGGGGGHHGRDAGQRGSDRAHGGARRGRRARRARAAPPVPGRRPRGRGRVPRHRPRARRVAGVPRHGAGAGVPRVAAPGAPPRRHRVRRAVLVDHRGRRRARRAAPHVPPRRRLPAARHEQPVQDAPRHHPVQLRARDGGVRAGLAREGDHDPGVRAPELLGPGTITSPSRGSR